MALEVMVVEAIGGSMCIASSTLWALLSTAKLCLWEFPTSLTDGAYTWYLDLKPRSIPTGTRSDVVFNTKFFCTGAKILPDQVGLK